MKNIYIKYLHNWGEYEVSDAGALKALSGFATTSTT